MAVAIHRREFCRGVIMWVIVTMIVRVIMIMIVLVVVLVRGVNGVAHQVASVKVPVAK
ncbi:hypothetical protein C4K02_5613 [Pseudomonas synxantha]|nr:hypothetical protein C4K02_5613 [Pseudomonas synxantha]